MLDPIHRAPCLRFEIVLHVLLDLIALVRMIVIDRQRRRTGEPEKLAALDLDGGRKRHVDGLVIIRVVDDFHVRIRRLVFGA